MGIFELENEIMIKDKTYLIYKIIFPNSKCYIGMTCNLRKRKIQHKRRSKDTTCNYAIYNAIRKYGFDNLGWEILSEGLTLSEAEILEIDLINSSKPNYNMAAGGMGHHMSEESRKKLSKSLKDRKLSESSKNNMIMATRERFKEYRQNIISEISKIYEFGMSIKDIKDITNFSEYSIRINKTKWLEEFNLINSNRKFVLYKMIFKNKKTYIGFTDELAIKKERFKTNSKDKIYRHNLYNAIRKYGFESIQWEILEENLSFNEVETLGINYIKQERHTYNKKNISMIEEISEEISKCSVSSSYSPKHTSSKEFIDKRKLKSSETWLRKSEPITDKIAEIYQPGMKTSKIKEITGFDDNTIKKYKDIWMEKYSNRKKE